MNEKTRVEDIDRSVYDIRDEEHDAYRMEAGLTPEIIDKLSKEKNDPVWMQQFRLQSLQIYNEMKTPDWGPSLEGLDMEPTGMTPILFSVLGIFSFSISNPPRMKSKQINYTTFY